MASWSYLIQLPLNKNTVWSSAESSVSRLVESVWWNQAGPLTDPAHNQINSEAGYLSPISPTRDTGHFAVDSYIPGYKTYLPSNPHLNWNAPKRERVTFMQLVQQLG